MESTAAIILAAGQGTRMKSATPKVMHLVCGLPLVHFVVQAALDASCDEVIVVTGHGREVVEAYLAKAFAHAPLRTCVQDQQRGTGDAARIGLDATGGRCSRVLLLSGDIPLVRSEDLLAVMVPLSERPLPADLVLATCVLDDPSGYGRILRRGNGRLEIREDRDLRTADERQVREVNAGIYATSAMLARETLAGLTTDNAQAELYLTDIVAASSAGGRRVATVNLDADAMMGVNDRQQLIEVDHLLHARLLRKWRLAGTTIHEGARVEAPVVLHPDATIESGAVLRGATQVERGATVGIGCVLSNVVVAQDAVIRPYTVATDAHIGALAQVGPFAHLRSQTVLGEQVHIGNFVETKNTRMALGAKANHLSYLGDGVIGERANVGAGTIFCNYDGVQKHTTTIEAGAFIGSDSQLVAPVTIGADSYIATGTTVTQDVPPGALAIGRVKQENKEGYAARLRARLKAAKAAKEGLKGT